MLKSTRTQSAPVELIRITKKISNSEIKQGRQTIITFLQFFQDTA